MELKHVEGRVIVKVNMEAKNFHTFSDGTMIRLERKYENFDNKYTQPVNAFVISGEGMVPGSEILIHHNATHETNRITNHGQISGEEIASEIRYFSVLTSECFAWRNGDEWLPLPPFDFGLRIFKPYNGVIAGIEPELIKNTLYMTTGEYKGVAALTLRASDYEIIFQDTTGVEGNLIRIRTSEDDAAQREMEVVAIDHSLTQKIMNGEYYVGLNKKDCKPLNSYLNDRRRTKQNDTIIAP